MLLLYKQSSREAKVWSMFCRRTGWQRRWGRTISQSAACMATCPRRRGMQSWQNFDQALPESSSPLMSGQEALTSSRYILFCDRGNLGLLLDYLIVAKDAISCVPLHLLASNESLLREEAWLTRFWFAVQVSLVINYDLPNSRELYIHRIGRSGRFGRKGVAINFVRNDDVRILRDIEQFYSTQIDEMVRFHSQAKGKRCLMLDIFVKHFCLQYLHASNSGLTLKLFSHG